MQTLTTQQVHSLNRKHGAGLEEGKGKMYVQSFLINSQQNQAGDPHPFRVDEKLLPKLARTAIGMPWLPYPKSDGNHQRPIGAAAFTADGIKQHQQQFAGGEIVAQYTNEGTGNVNVIIDVFPEYQEAVRSKKIPEFVSPMIFPHEMTPSGLVKEGEILHLQSVHNPGYAPEVAKINSVCEGNGLKQCMTQMKALAASGKLAPFQSKVKNYIAKNVSPADKTQMGKVKIGGETNWYDANKNEFQFSPEYKHNFPNPEKLPIVVQHEIGHMHWHHTLTPAQRKAFAKNVPKDLEISPYAIQHKRMLFKAVTAFRKDKSSKNRKAVKRAYGEYIREVFAILHSMRQEPDYVQRLKTDGLKQGMSAYMGALGAAGPLDDATFNKKVRRVNDSMTKPNRRGHIPNKILKQTDIEDVTRRHASHPKRTPKLNPAKYAPYTPTLKKGDKNWIPAMQMSSTRLSLSQQQLTANKKTFNELIKRNPGLAKTLAAREKVTNSQNRRNQRLFKHAPTLWRGGDEKELEALYKKGHFAGTGGGTGFDFKATSLDKGTAKMFAKGTDPYMMKIDAKPLRDSRLARLVKYSHKPTLEKFGEKYNKPYSDKYLEEKEVRLRPGTPFKFDSGKKLIKQIHFNTSDPKRQKELSAKYGDLAEKITFGDYKALGAKRLGPRHENKKRLKIPGKGLLRTMVKDRRTALAHNIRDDENRVNGPFWGRQTHLRNKIALATEFYKPNNVRLARIYAKEAPYLLEEHKNWRIPEDAKKETLDKIAKNQITLKRGIDKSQEIVDKSKGIKKKPSMTLKVAKPPALPNKMGKPKKKPKFTMTPTGGGKDIPIEDDAFEALVKRERVRPKKKMTKYEKSMDLKRMNKELHLSRNPQERKSAFFPKHPDYIKNTEDYISGKNALTDTPTHRNLLRRMKRERNTLFRKTKIANRMGKLPKKTLGKKKPKTLVENIESGLKKNKSGSGKRGFMLSDGEMVPNNRGTHEEMLREAVKKSYKKGFPTYDAYERSHPSKTLENKKNAPIRYSGEGIEMYNNPTSNQIKSLKDYVIERNGRLNSLDIKNIQNINNRLFAEKTMKRRLGINHLGEDGQSDRAAERYKAEQSEDKILTKKNTSAKYRRQVKDDRSAYARKNPKYAALRPELRKHMSLKTRRANKMGVENMSGKSHTTRNRKMFRGDILQRNDVKNKKLKQMSPTQRRKSAEDTTDARKAFAEAGVSNERRRLKEIAGGKVMKVGTMRMDGTSNMRVVHPPEMFNVYTRGQSHDELKNNRKKLTRRTRVQNRMGVPPNANMIKTAFSNVLGAQTA